MLLATLGLLVPHSEAAWDEDRPWLSRLLGSVGLLALTAPETIEFLPELQAELASPLTEEAVEPPFSESVIIYGERHQRKHETSVITTTISRKAHVPFAEQFFMKPKS